MKQLNYCRALGMTLLMILAYDCNSDENIFETTTAVSYTSVYYGTSSNKFYSAENEFKAMQFAQVNWSNLTADMASGQGEYLSAMADLIGVKPAQKTAFYKRVKSNFSQILPTAETTAAQLVDGLKVAGLLPCNCPGF